MENNRLPNMHNQDQEWLYLEDRFLLPSIFDEASIVQTMTYPEFMPTNLPKIDFQEYQPKSICTQNLENFSSDFNLWSEFPSLCEDAWDLPSLSQIPPILPFSNTTFNDNNIDNKFWLNTFNFKEESLDMIVAEGFSIAKSHENHIMEGNNNHFNGDYYVKEEKFKRINKGENPKGARIESVTYEEIRKYFNFPISMAAKELNVGLTPLKKRCRDLNIKRWPYRKIKSLESLISNIKEDNGTMELVKYLEDYKNKLDILPGLELNEETKRLRQQIFKANYKKRRANINKTLIHM